jgi:AcrR family transcriptional regulator
MTRLANRKPRPYQSDLRAEQAEETRIRILEAAGRLIVSGVASVSIPAVAREAGVSVPTVYRHFGTKAELLDAIYPHFVQKARVRELPTPRTIDEFHEMVRSLFTRYESLGEVGRAAMTSPASEEVRRLGMPDRLAISRRFVAEVAPHASAVDQERMARVFIVLTSSGAMRMWTEHIGSSVDEAADDIDWMVRAAIAATHRETDR